MMSFYLKTFTRFVLCCVVLVLVVHQVKAQTTSLNDVNGNFSVSSPFVPAGQTFTVTQLVRNDGSQAINNVSVQFSLEWGIGQSTNLINFQSASCTGALTGGTFANGSSSTVNTYSSTPASLPAGATSVCTLTLQVAANSAIGDMFEFKSKVISSSGGEKMLGGDVVTTDSPDGGICENVDTTSPTPTTVPSACNVECGSGLPACEDGSACQQGRCVPAVCSITGFTCDPSTCLALCPSVTMSNTAPKIGDTVNFQCTVVPGAVRYKFQVIAPSGSISSLESNSNVSNGFQLTEQGHYDVQCQMCMGATDDTCLAPQEM